MPRPHQDAPPTPVASPPKKPALPARVVRVHAMKDGYAVFGDGGLPLSETLPSRDEAIAEAKLVLGGPGTVLVVGEAGQVVVELIHHG